MSGMIEKMVIFSPSYPWLMWVVMAMGQDGNLYSIFFYLN